MCFPEIYVPKLFIHALSLLDFITAIIFSLFSFLGLSHFQENQPDIPPEPPEPAILIRELLPVFKFSDLDSAAIAGEGHSPESCVVCLDEFEGDDDIRCLLNCKHIFHKSCLDRWMDHGSKTCPYCRKHFVPPHLLEEFNQRLWEAYYSDTDLCVEGII